MDIDETLEKVAMGDCKECVLIVLHPEVAHGLTSDGIHQVNLDQMNPRRMMDPSFCTLVMKAQQTREEFVPDCPHNGLLKVLDSGGSSTTGPAQ